MCKWSQRGSLFFSQIERIEKSFRNVFLNFNLKLSKIRAKDAVLCEEKLKLAKFNFSAEEAAAMADSVLQNL